MPIPFFRRDRSISDSPDWRRLLSHAVGGLTEVGFSADESFLLVVSFAGRGLFDLASGARLARDPEAPASGVSWIEGPKRLVRGIASAQDQWIPVVGLWGGELAQSSQGRWSVQVASSGGRELAYLHDLKSRERWLVDQPFGEIKAFGFSTSGRLLVLATSSDIDVYRTVAGWPSL